MKNVKIKNILLLSWPFFASAVMLTVIQAPVSWAPLAWVSLVPFILACSPDVKPRRLALVSYIISLCYWLGNLYWICPVTVLGWIAFCLYTALLWPILALCLRYCRIKKIPLFLAVPILVVGAERLQGFFLGGFFWRFLAHSQYQNITLIQIADIFGAGGVSFLIAMVNGLLAELILDTLRIPRDSFRRTPCGGCSILNARFWKSVFRIRNLFEIGLVGTALVAAIVYGRWRISQENQFVESGPVAASLQSNVPQSVKRTFQAGKQIFDELMKQSKASAQTGAELIVWPETMVQAILDTDVWPFLVSAENERTFDKTLKAHSKDTAFLLVGTYGGRIQQAQDTNISLAKYNSAVLYRPDGLKDDSRYDKIHLVPFGEFLPFRKSWPWLYNFLMKFTPYNYDYSLDAGSEYTVFEMTSPVRNHEEETSAYKFGVMICYEDTVPAIARKFALDEQGQKRLDWLVNISNDGWFVRFKSDPAARRANGRVSPSAELPQHAAICAFRAVENRLAVLRSVNTGISCLIDSFGRIRNGFLAGTLPHKAMARTGMAGWFADKIPIDRRVTFFSKYGQGLDFSRDFCLILLIIVPASIKLFRIKEYRTRLSGKPNEKHTQKS
ncbi:MAG: apolipoprotein N-acyltransferase [Planctomycetota bacterium]